MSLTSVLRTAASGLASVNAQLAVVSQNVANASTPGYAREVVANTNLTAGGVGFGVVTGPAREEVDVVLSAALNKENAAVAGAQVRSTALTSLDAAQGATGAGDDLSSKVGALQDSFTSLGADPSNQVNQGAVVGAASSLAGAIQSQAVAYTTERQSAQGGLETDVTTLNSTLAVIGSLSDQIIAAQVKGISTADLEAQRTTQEQTAAQLGGLYFLPSANGDVTAVVGASVVNTRAKTGPFSIATTTLQNGTAAPPLLLSGSDVTSQVTGGTIGARLSLRDTDIPILQAGLDEFAETLSTRLSSQGLTLFTTPSGSTPATGGSPVQSGYVGFSSDISVNPVVVANANLVRDGTQTVAAGTGNAAGFTPNPTGGPVGFNTLIDNVLTYAFGANAQEGVAQPAPSTTGLGASGTFALAYNPGTTLQTFAANLASSQAEAAGNAQSSVSDSQALQSSLQSKLTSETGVSIDTELSNMIVLQNAYGANAKIISAAQTMFSTLLGSVNP
jgi:flagellar hook-associated protein 1 FlgK